MGVAVAVAAAEAAVVVVGLDVARLAVEEEEEAVEVVVEEEEAAGGGAGVCLGPWWQRGTGHSLNRWRWSRLGRSLKA